MPSAWTYRLARANILVVYLSSLAGATAVTACAADSIDVTPRPVERIVPGTVIDENSPAGTIRLVLLAKSRLGSGDVLDTPSLALKYTGLFHLAILAQVGSDRDGDSIRYRLTKVAVGLCLPIHGQNVVISSTTQQRLGANLSFVAQRVLSSSEKNLDQVVQVARHPTLSIVDAKAIVLRDGEHCDMIVRHMIWVHPKSGKLGTLVWLLQTDSGPGYRLAQSAMQALPPGFVEDRVVNVKSSEFTFGFPSDRAFAIVDIPQGKSIPVTPELGQLASSRMFTPATLSQLAGKVNQAIVQQRARGNSKGGGPARE